MQISVSELKANTGKYLDLVDDQEIIVTKNGKRIAKLVSAKIDKKESVKALIGALPPDMDYGKLRAERILN